MRGGTKYTITIDRHRISHGITIGMTMASCPLPHMSNGHRPRYHHNPDASTASLGNERVGFVKEVRKEKLRRKLEARRARPPPMMIPFGSNGPIAPDPSLPGQDSSCSCTRMARRRTAARTFNDSVTMTAMLLPDTVAERSRPRECSRDCIPLAGCLWRTIAFAIAETVVATSQRRGNNNGGAHGRCHRACAT